MIRCPRGVCKNNYQGSCILESIQLDWGSEGMDSLRCKNLEKRESKREICRKVHHYIQESENGLELVEAIKRTGDNDTNVYNFAKENRTILMANLDVTYWVVKEAHPEEQGEKVIAIYSDEQFHKIHKLAKNFDWR